MNGPELDDGEVVAVRAYAGGVIIIAFAPGAPLDHAAGLRDTMAAQCDVPVFAVADVAAVRAWEPPAELAMLRADLADAEAEILKWPRCPAGCRCRVGTDDADALECGCDGPCTTGWGAPAAKADDPRAVIGMIWRMCQKPGGEGLADRIAGLIKNSGMEPS